MQETKVKIKAGLRTKFAVLFEGDSLRDIAAELMYYLDSHEAAGVIFDSVDIALNYDNAVEVVLTKNLSGRWVITDVYVKR